MSWQIDQTGSVDKTTATRHRVRELNTSAPVCLARGAKFRTNESAFSIVRARSDHRSITPGWVCRALCLAHTRAASI